MSAVVRSLSIILVSFAVTAFSGYQAQKTVSLTVKVKELKNSEGTVQFALYNRGGSIPDEHYENYVRLLKKDICDRSAQITFHDIPPGQYAVNILHDENGNGKIDKGLVLPKEGIGFSNYESIGLRKRPAFDKASFLVLSDTSIVVKVVYL